jgi:hypothetical protein
MVYLEILQNVISQDLPWKVFKPILLCSIIDYKILDIVLSFPIILL